MRFESSGLLGLMLLVSAGAAEAAAPRIDLYTMGRGRDLFTMFGHAALCVVEPELPGGGLCYNYGTTDFSRPVGLSWDVIRGQAEFWVSVTDLPSMVMGFESEQRTIYRQALPLSDERALELALRLRNDASPDNRVYVYNHYLDNCSTRPRDHIDAATRGALRELSHADGSTYRDYAVEGLGSFSWLLVPASDYLMGRWVDQKVSTYQAMFIPEVLRKSVEIALGATPEVVYRRALPEPSANVSAARLGGWALVVGIVVALALSVRGGRSRLVATGPLVLTGLGALLLVAALVSRLPELRVNELLAVFFPADFLLLASSLRLVRVYSWVRLAVLALVAVLAAGGVLIQPLWPYWVLAVGVLSTTLIATRSGQRRPSAA